MAEYAFILGVVAVVVMVALTPVGSIISNLLASVTSLL